MRLGPPYDLGFGELSVSASSLALKFLLPYGNPQWRALQYLSSAPQRVVVSEEILSQHLEWEVFSNHPGSQSHWE